MFTTVILGLIIMFLVPKLLNNFGCSFKL